MEALFRILWVGIAANRAPSPAAARLHSVATHGVFGLWLYLAALAARFISKSTGD